MIRDFANLISRLLPTARPPAVLALVFVQIFIFAACGRRSNVPTKQNQLGGIDYTGDSGGGGDAVGQGDESGAGDPGTGDEGSAGDNSAGGDPAGDPSVGGDSTGDASTGGDPGDNPGDNGSGDPSDGDNDTGGDSGGGTSYGAECVDPPPPPPARGTYDVQKAAVAGLGQAWRVEFSPDGTYAIILNSYGRLHVYHWQSQQSIYLDVPSNVYLMDLAFSPDGLEAWIVGSTGWRTGPGKVYHFDDGAYRASLGGGSTGDILTDVATLTQPVLAIQYPWQPDRLPILLQAADQTGGSSIAYVREFDTGTYTYGDFQVATATSAGCWDLAVAQDADGQEGYLVVCGHNGADIQYYSTFNATWSTSVAGFSLGNVQRVAAYCGGAYALTVNYTSSSPKLYRFEQGLMWPSADTVGLPGPILIIGAKFQQQGQRALLFGARGGTRKGALQEYIHGDYSSAGIADLDITTFFDPDGDGVPSSDYVFNDVAFRPGCDGGLVVGGYTGDLGVVAEFQIQSADARPCR